MLFFFLKSCNISIGIIKKWLNPNLTCGTNILGNSVEVTMKRSLTIFFQIFLICTLFTNAWGLTNHERCVEAYFIDKDFTNAYHFCKEDEDSNAQYIIGEMYYNGFGVKEDHAEAAIWFRKAAEQGNPEAQYVIGQMYYNGLGVKEDHAEAIIWFRKAAKQGHIRARVLRDKMLDKDKSK
jgi:TPR repeat protein